METRLKRRRWAEINPWAAAQRDAQDCDWGWWLLGLIISLTLTLLWWWLQESRRAEGGRTPQARQGVVLQDDRGPNAVEISEKEERAPDDLRRIEGIGPKISRLFQDAGIRTFAQLAASDVAMLRVILDDAGIGRIADPTTWPEQAALAAAGDWDALMALQDSLKGGRRVT